MLKELIFTLLVVAKTSIASEWIDVSEPSIKQWHHKIWNLFIMGKITDQLNLKAVDSSQSNFGNKWFLVLEHLSSHNALPKIFTSLNLFLLPL